MNRFGCILLTCLASFAVIVPAALHPRPRLIWNASASVPIGLYAVRRAGPLHVGELVLVRSPKELASFLAERGYLPRGVPMLKHILALPGQKVCRSERIIFVDGMAMGEALDRDGSGRTLPSWQGCRVLSGGQIFVMNRLSASSFDGRYFGPLSASSIVGRADPFWTRKED